ncbi:MAG TPA: phospholipase D-like domain-containing protein, partial [Ktedonobacterales bacterium]|nr:phospholipase D-like domain-containing protein [Ktedonobacterales bacterium]
MQQQKLCAAEAVQCRLDKSSRSIFHVAQALHQKCLVVDDTAFIGGVDLTVCDDGDFNRWDTPAHLFEPADRSTDLGPAPHPWHDVHLLLTGAPVKDVEHNFLQRWQEAEWPWWKRMPPPLKNLTTFYLSGNRESGQKAAREEETGEIPPGAGPPISGTATRVQVIRTIPALTYRFAPAGIYGIAQSYTLAVRRAKRFIYLETQYLWLERFLGMDLLWLGWQSHHMRAFMEELAAAAERGVTVALVLPDHPNCGRFVTDGTIAWLLKHAPHAAAEGRLHFFCLGTAQPTPEQGVRRYRPVYVHAKVGIVDDLWATVGSANLNSRSLSHDAELNVAALDPAFARGLRLSLWAEHLGALSDAHTGWPAPAVLPLPKPMAVPSDDDLRALVAPTDMRAPLPADEQPLQDHYGEEELAALEDPLAGIALLARRAQENLKRLRQGEPLVGHILPYLHSEEGAAFGVKVDRFCGVLDPLDAEQTGVPVRHMRRYT